MWVFFTQTSGIKGRTNCPWMCAEGKGPILTSPRRYPDPAPIPATGKDSSSHFGGVNPEVLSRSGTGSPFPGIHILPPLKSQSAPQHRLPASLRLPGSRAVVQPPWGGRRGPATQKKKKRKNIIFLIFKISWETWAMPSERLVSWCRQYLPTKPPWCPKVR